MHRALDPLAQALDDLPIFPLPGVSLFPGALLPLHIFEPRYRAMTRHVLGSHGFMAVVQLVDGDPFDDQPAIARVAGVGLVEAHQQLDDGRFNLLLRGHGRVSLEELPFTPPFRRARATLLPEVGPSPTEGDVAALYSSATAFLSLVKRVDPRVETRLPTDVLRAHVGDVMAQALVVDAATRQHILELDAPLERLRLTIGALAEQLASLTQQLAKKPTAYGVS